MDNRELAHKLDEIRDIIESRNKTLEDASLSDGDSPIWVLDKASKRLRSY